MVLTFILGFAIAALIFFFFGQWIAAEKILRHPPQKSFEVLPSLILRKGTGTGIHLNDDPKRGDVVFQFPEPFTYESPEELKAQHEAERNTLKAKQKVELKQFEKELEVKHKEELNELEAKHQAEIEKLGKEFSERKQRTKPTKSDYDLAAERIKRGWTWQSAFSEWQKENPERDLALSDSWESFKKAMDNRGLKYQAN